MNDFELHRRSKEWPPSKMKVSYLCDNAIVIEVKSMYEISKPKFDLMKEGDQRDVNKEQKP